MLNIVDSRDFISHCKHFGFTLNELGSKGRPLEDKLGGFEQRNDLIALPCVLTGSLWLC